MSGKRDIREGSALVWDGKRCTVAHIGADAVVLRDLDFRHFSVRWVDLLTPAAEGGRVRLAIIDDEASQDGEDAPEEEPDALSIVWTYASDAQRQEAEDRAAHVREVTTGYRSGFAEVALVNEPRPEYDPSAPRAKRWHAKAQELGVSVRTVGRWVADYEKLGTLGLVDNRRAAAGNPFARVDSRWVRVMEVLLDERTDEARISAKALFAIVKERLAAEFGAETVKIPSQATQYRLVRELDRGRGIVRGATKTKRSYASRPAAPFRRIFATRPGEYVLMDSTRLDVYAIDPLTGRWMNTDLTIIMDLYSRAILGLRLTVVAAKSIDVSSVFYEAIVPKEIPANWGSDSTWPYHGVPSHLMINVDHVGVPSVISLLGQPKGLIPDTLVIDHGKPYVSEHMMSVCARLGVSVQPARKATGTDKPQVERFFRTLRSQLLERLPGFKGEDITARGKDPESEAVYTTAEIEAIIREWVATIYHHRPTKGLRAAGLPGVDLTPAQRFEQGLGIAGELQIPVDRNLALEVLPTFTRRFNHYGVEFNKLIYTGEIVAKYHRRSRHLSAGGTSWAFSYNPDDVTVIYFQDPDDGVWHTLEWIRRQELKLPFSEDALNLAKQIAVSGDEPINIEDALASLLDSVRAGLARTPTERRIAAREAALFAQAEHPALPSMAAALEEAREAPDDPIEPAHDADLESDDDIADDLTIDYYSSAWEDL